MRTSRLLPFAVVAALAITSSAGCQRRSIAFVDVTGSVAEPIDALRVTLTAGVDEIVLTYPPAEGMTTIPLPTSFTVNVTGLADGTPLLITVVAVSAGADVASGSDTQNVDLGNVVNYVVALKAIGPVCGDESLDAGEECDGTELGGASCTTVPGGFSGGALACGATCSFDTSGCTAAPVCGNATVETGEDCDGTNLGGAACDTIGQGFVGGTLACETDCSFDTAACTAPPGCGDGAIGGTEDCDGTNLGGATCIDEGFDGGSLACTGGCVFDTSACFACGNGVIEAGESCDGTALGSATCVTLGFASGTLVCAGDCSYDTTGCTAPSGCGNAAIDVGEECDGANLGAATCIGQGFDGGTLTCSASCLLDTGACYECGNGLVEAAEECDGSDLGAASCTTLGLGFTGGTLACSGACTFDAGGCTTCGDGVAEAGEQCDGADLAGNTCTTAGMFQEGTLTCTGACTFETSMCIACGDGVAEGMEECDASDLGGASCTTIGQGFIGGTLGCASATCTYDTSACTLPPNCPNGTINAPEDCDPPAMGAGTCSSETGGTLPSGALTCTAACAYDATACYACGNGTVEGPEACDTSAFGGETCVSLGHDGGTLACAAGCLLIDETMCTDCGDAVAEGAEPCDGADLGGESCVTVGAFSGGTLACNPTCSGFVTSGCFGPPTVPTLRKPINSTYMGSMFVTGSRRPTFTWEASTVMGGAGINYDLQYSTDPTFVLGVTTVTTAFLNHMPTTDLAASSAAPVGARYWWRVRACAGSACSGYSTAWYVNVGRSDRDFNGDGYADVVVGAPSNDGAAMNAGRVYLFLGGSGSTLNTTADLTLSGEAADDSFGTTAAFAGDLNNDGFSDVVVGAYLNDSGGVNAGRVYVYFGSVGMDGVSDGAMNGPAASASFGRAVAGAGDVNGDGYADLVAGEWLSSVGGTNAGRAHLYLGGPGASLDTASDAILTGPMANLMLGWAVASAGDMNGDGFADLLVGATQSAVSGTGRAYVYFGSAGASFDTTSDVTFLGASGGDDFGYSVSSAGDVNADGFSDVVIGVVGSDVGAMNAGRAHVFLGGLSIDTVADGTVTGGAAGERLGWSVGTAGDANNDGYADVIVGVPSYSGVSPTAGRAFVFYGAAGSSFDTTANGTINGAATMDKFGKAVFTVGDANGDGFVDLAIGAPFNDAGAANAGRAYVYFGSTGTAFNTTADGTLTGEASGDTLGSTVSR